MMTMMIAMRKGKGTGISEKEATASEGVLIT